MKVSEEFPSYFLSGDEVNGHEVPVAIKEVKKEMVPTRPGKPDEEVISVYFQDKKRGMRLNKTRAKEIRAITGEDDMEKWIGTQIILYTEKQNAFGEWHNVLHCKAGNGVKPSLPQEDEEEVIDLNDIPV